MSVVFRRAVAVCVAVAVAPVSAIAASQAGGAVWGRNYSDVGVAMYERSGLALFVELAVYALLLVVALAVLLRLFWPERRWILGGAALPVVATTIVHGALALWSYG